MKSRSRCCRAWLLACAVFGGCLSSGAPLPPVRWFDPTPPPPDAATPSRAFSVRVDAPAWFGREFLVRVGPYELAIDAQHQWLAEPRQIVATVLSRALASTPTALAGTEVELQAFELDVTQAPRAHVRVAFVGPRPNALPAVLEEWAGAADRSPAAFAAAMAQALARLDASVRAR